MIVKKLYYHLGSSMIAITILNSDDSSIMYFTRNKFKALKIT